MFGLKTDDLFNSIATYYPLSVKMGNDKIKNQVGCRPGQERKGIHYGIGSA